MRFQKQKLAAAALLTTGLAVLSGCPPQPELFVTPLALTLGDSASETEFRISNTGGGTLNWTLSEDLPWLSLEPASSEKQDTLGGSTNTETDVIRVIVDREPLAVGTTTGQITITSNGGTSAVAVSVVKAAPPQLVVSTDALNLGTGSNQGTFTVANTGRELLDWQAAVAPGAPWLSVAPSQGSVDVGANAATLTVTANRTGLAAGAYNGTINITSNGGSAAVNVFLTVSPFSVTPAQLDFGRLVATDDLQLTIRNGSASPAPLTLAASTDSGGSWLAVAPQDVNLPASQTLLATVTVNPAGLAPGDYTGTISITDTSNNFTVEVEVSMSVSGFNVSRRVIDFGSISSPTTQTFDLTNLGSTALNFAINFPPDANPWLDLAPATGSLPAQQTQTVSVEVNPIAVEPGARETTLTVSAGGATETIIVRFSRPVPPTLVVEPDVIDLGTGKTEELVGIWNAGTGTLDWAIDTSSFPAWLTLTPVDGNGVASGTVSGEETDAVTIQVDRSLVPLGETAFSHEFTVAGSGDSDEDVTVRVFGAIAQIPEVVIEAEGIDENQVNFINFDVGENSTTFIIRNEGTGTLNWTLNQSTVPDWVTSVAPSQGTLDPGEQQTVTVSVSRNGLNYLGAQAIVILQTNDPNRESLPLLVEIQVPKVAVIGARPTVLAFGVNVTTDTIEVANLGDPDTVLDFQVTSSKEWLSVFPNTGQSIGTASPLKDFRPISVTVDRSLLDGDGAAAKLTISAFEIRDGQRFPAPGIAPVEVDVSVEAAQLTIETAPPRLREPSLVRYVLLMRNVRYQALPIPATRLGQVGNLFNIRENGQPLELTETSQFLTSANRIRGNALILLDYSGSMQASARSVADPDVVNAPDPLQFLYERAISSLIQELPQNYRIGIALFNERGAGVLRRITDSPAETPVTQGELFIKDRDVLLSRLDNIVVVDNGASALLPALERAADTFVRQDTGFIPFDDADVRALIAVTDGRLTTPPGSISETATVLEDAKVRLMAIGWGNSVAADPLIRIAQPTGGHLYSTRTQDTGEVDAFGTPIRIPIAAELEDWTSTDPADTCDQSIAKDLRSQVVLSYVSLTEEAGVTSEAQLTFNDPNDQASPCLPEQGNISGGFVRGQLDLDTVAGDERLGQISLRSEGIIDGQARVVARLEYAPRNITSLTLDISASSGIASVSTVPETDGGVIFDWNQSVIGTTYTFTSPDAEPLRYGEFGDLLNIVVDGPADPLQVFFEVDAPVISGDPNSKYFAHPDSIIIRANEESIATAFPLPAFTSNPPAISLGETDAGQEYAISLGANIPEAQITLGNIGGSHEPTGVGIVWEIEQADGDGEFEIVLEPNGAPIYSTLEPRTIRLIPNRCVEPGAYESAFVLLVEGRIPTVFNVAYSVLNPVLEVTPESLDFGPATSELPFTVSNTGQSNMFWTIDAGSLPLWLTTSRFSSTNCPDNQPDITSFARVNRQGLTPGLYTHTIIITASNGQTDTIDVSMVVP